MRRSGLCSRPLQTAQSLIHISFSILAPVIVRRAPLLISWNRLSSEALILQSEKSRVSVFLHPSMHKDLLPGQQPKMKLIRSKGVFYLSEVQTDLSSPWCMYLIFYKYLAAALSTPYWRREEKKKERKAPIR